MARGTVKETLEVFDPRRLYTHTEAADALRIKPAAWFALAREEGLERLSFTSRIVRLSGSSLNALVARAAARGASSRPFNTKETNP